MHWSTSFKIQKFLYINTVKCSLLLLCLVVFITVQDWITCWTLHIQYTVHSPGMFSCSNYSPSEVFMCLWSMSDHRWLRCHRPSDRSHCSSCSSTICLSDELQSLYTQHLMESNTYLHKHFHLLSPRHAFHLLRLELLLNFWTLV